LKLTRVRTTSLNVPLTSNLITINDNKMPIRLGEPENIHRLRYPEWPRDVLIFFWIYQFCATMYLQVVAIICIAAVVSARAAGNHGLFK